MTARDRALEEKAREWLETHYHSRGWDDVDVRQLADMFRSVADEARREEAEECAKIANNILRACITDDERDIATMEYKRRAEKAEAELAEAKYSAIDQLHDMANVLAPIAEHLGSVNQRAEKAEAELAEIERRLSEGQGNQPWSSCAVDLQIVREVRKL